MRICLTVDVEFPDQPTHGADTLQAILDGLARHAVPANMFVQGRWADACPDQVRRIRDAGHLIGHHSYWHASYTSLSAEGIREDLDRGSTALQTAAGIDVHPWFRFPYGRGATSPEVTGIVQAAGFTHVGWTVDPFDWHVHHDADEICDFVCAAIPHQEDPAVILVHSWPGSTPVALERALDRLAGEHTFHRLDDLPGNEISRLQHRRCLRNSQIPRKV